MDLRDGVIFFAGKTEGEKMVKLTNDFFKQNFHEIPFILYGAGINGVFCNQYMKKLSMENNIIYYVDSNSEKHGKYLCEKEIKKPSSIKDNPEAIIIISCSAYKEIHLMLRAWGCLNPIYAYLTLEPHIHDEPFIFDSGLLESYYSANDASSKAMIKIVSFVRNEENSKIQAIDDVEELVTCYHYWPPEWKEDISTLSSHITLCDGGAFDGDTFRQLYKDYGDNLKKYYGFEPSLDLFQKLEGCVKSHHFQEKSSIYRAGLGAKKEVLSFVSDDFIPMKGSFSSKENLNAKENIIPLDSLNIDVIGELCIKMDIEGFELQALEGARQTIKKYKPKLAICVYHRTNDILHVPEFIKSIDSDYECVLRGGTHMVCYASNMKTSI